MWIVEAERIAMAEVSMNEIGLDQTWTPDTKRLTVVLDQDTAAYVYGATSEDVLPKGKRHWDPKPPKDKPWVTGNYPTDPFNKQYRANVIVSGPDKAKDEFVAQPASQAHALAQRLNEYEQRPALDQIAECEVPYIESDASLFVTIFRYVSCGMHRILVQESEAYELVKVLNGVSVESRA